MRFFIVFWVVMVFATGNACAAKSISIDDLEVGDAVDGVILAGSMPIPLAGGEWRVARVKDKTIESEDSLPSGDAVFAVLESAKKAGHFFYFEASVGGISTTGWNTNACDKKSDSVFLVDMNGSYSNPECFGVEKNKINKMDVYMASYHFFSTRRYATLIYFFPLKNKGENDDDYLGRIKSWAKVMADSAHATIADKSEPVLPPLFDFKS